MHGCCQCLPRFFWLLGCLLSCAVFADQPPPLTSAPRPIITSSQWLIATPDKCVVAKQGDPCKASVELRWQLAIPGDVCLYLVGNENPIQCWRNRQAEVYQLEVNSPQKLDFKLTRIVDGQLLAEGSIEVVWLHQPTAQKYHWRVF
ncbi:DUF3019 domain-containing protein [Corallincola holothuriorum]|uniref:DUF3019 domain-containing protein n=1 Tax=Corallincola holothuriorum TaxID=2282215 RepID=A0A368NF33_9GAMM|nr:DUF3019 domain-containing protein [Corallincola holothuriorum]RCU49088.1 DUF3019 domain-containing protein [Corallincola holothuriorum]